jgi:hypothetical protein
MISASGLKWANQITKRSFVQEGDRYAAALTKFRFIANAVWSMEEAVKAMNSK